MAMQAGSELSERLGEAELLGIEPPELGAPKIERGKNGLAECDCQRL